MSVVFALVVDCDNVGVAQLRCGAGLTAEPLNEGLILGKVGAHDLECDLAVKALVQSDVDRRHSTIGQVREHAVASIENATDGGEGIGGGHPASLRNSEGYPCRESRT